MHLYIWYTKKTFKAKHAECKFQEDKLLVSTITHYFNWLQKSQLTTCNALSLTGLEFNLITSWEPQEGLKNMVSSHPNTGGLNISGWVSYGPTLHCWKLTTWSVAAN